MPITSRLSRRLYETFGDEAAADLVDWMYHVDTQRSEMREMQEVMLARLDARFAQFEATMVSRLEGKIAALDTKVEQKAADLMKWSLVFWVGAVGAIAALAGVIG